ncbi:MAG: hypothetical protein HFF06_01950 [Oscillospiraceae bacterium]|jgi:hypothetical protein|nr:hypothetical protein [Oscillospiraceae bacterium]
MKDPASILFSHVMEEDIYMEYIDNPAAFRAKRKANSAVYDRLCVLLDAPAKKELDALLDEKLYIDSIYQEAAFTAGLALGLQLLRLL